MSESKLNDGEGFLRAVQFVRYHFILDHAGELDVRRLYLRNASLFIGQELVARKNVALSPDDVNIRGRLKALFTANHAYVQGPLSTVHCLLHASCERHHGLICAYLHFLMVLAMYLRHRVVPESLHFVTLEVDLLKRPVVLHPSLVLRQSGYKDYWYICG
ncbi:hypothetical protein [Citrobacter sp. wls826]|uniref:hypothetical protein n=1 Tax=Citrobacter sp. wls826 TaxID=2576415 RepID=UPI0010CA18DB|nr:hypothetical protein [Citrobacter sp. wls826]TKU26097.1 hypothetical protein FDW87_00070 [Citrobacter sp. wls826]TKV30126.1 hypothetical protein FDX20_27310 [Citrobacter sp. TBCS-11]